MVLALRKAVRLIGLKMVSQNAVSKVGMNQGQMKLILDYCDPLLALLAIELLTVEQVLKVLVILR